MYSRVVDILLFILSRHLFVVVEGRDISDGDYDTQDGGGGEQKEHMGRLEMGRLGRCKRTYGSVLGIQARKVRPCGSDHAGLTGLCEDGQD